MVRLEKLTVAFSAAISSSSNPSTRCTLSCSASITVFPVINTFLSAIFSRSRFSFEILLKSKFDFFHVDGAHKNKIITQEFNCIKKLNKTDVLEIIFDDDITCQSLIKSIETTYKVEDKISAGKGWFTNLYLKIKLPKSRFEKLKLNLIFLIKNHMKYLLLKLKKL